MRTQKGFNRAAVTEAAAELADQHGLSQLTLAMLAGELGVRSQSLYAHVDGIDGLRREMALLGQRQLAERLRDAVMGVSGADALRALCHAYAEFAAERPGLYEATLRAPGNDEEIAAANERVAAPFFAVLTSFGLDQEDVVHLYRIIWTSLYGFSSARTADLMSWPVDPDVSLQQLVDGLVAIATGGDGSALAPAKPGSAQRRRS